MMPFESFMARRYLKVRHQRRFVSLITVLAAFGVAVGVMVLVVVIAVMSGFQSELKKRILGIEAHLIVMRYNGWIDHYDQVAENLRTIEGVKNASPFVYGQGMLRAAGGVSSIILRGIDPSSSKIDVNTSSGQSLGKMLTAGSAGAEIPVVLGTVLADKLKLAPGDGAMLMVVGGRQADLRHLPHMQRIKVVGLFDTGMHQYDGSMGFVRMTQLQTMLGAAGLATGIEVRVKDPDHVERINAKIIARLGFEFWANDWKQLHRNLFSMLALQKIMMYVILTLIIIVAAFNVSSALIMMVREKTKDIAILKAMGASQESLRKIFLVKGLVIGSVGIGMGMTAGLMVCMLLDRYQFITLPGDVYFLTTLPVRIEAMDIGAIVLGTILICIFASLYPAKQAARMNPVDAIRYG
jgi:lipoprotein-releasing system permease protein